MNSLLGLAGVFLFALIFNYAGDTRSWMLGAALIAFLTSFVIQYYKGEGGRRSGNGNVGWQFYLFAALIVSLFMWMLPALSYPLLGLLLAIQVGNIWWSKDSAASRRREDLHAQMIAGHERAARLRREHEALTSPPSSPPAQESPPRPLFDIIFGRK